MQISVQVSEEILKAAAEHQKPLVEFVESLIARGLEAIAPKASVTNAIDRIRALRSSS